MHERRKREDSFYFPYLDILPSLNNLSEWADHELLLLQDDKLIAKAESTKKMLKISYAKCILKLCDMYPVELPHEEFNFDNFVFSWYTIQARAFGRRLPWTALVPFADCLNHKNVQTKYDFIPNEATYEKQFRLLVTGTNRYAKGSEAFNSYGRRPNDNLLLEYGFAMMDNEWDELPLTLSLSNAYGLFTDKVALVCAMRRVITKTYYVHLRELNTEALHFLRLCACDTPEELEIFKANGWGHDEEHKVVSLSNEIRALGLFADAVCTLLHETLNAQTNLDSDMQLLANTNTNEVAAGRINTGADENIEREKIQFFYDNRLRPALTYRITRKKLATEMIRRVRVLIEILSSIQSVSAKVCFIFSLIQMHMIISVNKNAWGRVMTAH